MQTETYTLRDTTRFEDLGPAADVEDFMAWVAALERAAEADDRVISYSHPKYTVAAATFNEAVEIFKELMGRAWNGGNFA